MEIVILEDQTDGKIKDQRALKMEFDGSCEPKNPGGVASIGWCIRNPDGEIIVKGAQVVADGGKLATNNFAEYCALGMPLKWLLDQEWRGTLDVTGDSKLVVEQVNKRWRCKSPHLQKLRERVFEVLEELELKINNTFNLVWVPRDENEEADGLGRHAYELYCQSKNRPVRFMKKRPKPTKPKQKRTYIIYDSRAAGGDTEDANVIEAGLTEAEALRTKGEYGGISCFSYVEEGDKLVDEQHEWNWFPGEPK